ncbi:MAG: hypothetical protein EOO75_13830 [Myxococcales bacterium]|nr:MAG: hypothetical protein EOO75_13830 [Myxococcales bacterium]
MRCRGLLLLLWAGCSRSPGADPRDTAPPDASAVPVTGVPPSAAPATVVPASAAPSASAALPSDACPDGMVRVDGGLFWMGHTHGATEEAPRHRVAVRSFCLDRTEVTTGAYDACAAAGTCTPAHRGAFCNTGREDRGEHPINCVDWHQSVAFCQQRGARLPTEREWEYTARHGDEQREFSWGREPPDGRCCYSQPSTCRAGSYPPGPYGTVDLTGNVWEWTASAFSTYPLETLEGHLRVYRGGSFSRRFPTWMRNGLRNRFAPKEFGAHLGLRCARDLPGSACPAGSHPPADPARSATGCQPDGEPEPTAAAPLGPGPASSGFVAPATEPVTITRDARFDGDCGKYKPGHPLGFAVRGGTFVERQRAKGGCVNRDVGVGFNSVCCAP